MWAAIEADFHREYRVDMSAPGVLRSHTWRWFVVRLSGLSPDSVTRALLRKDQKRADGGASAMQTLAAASRAGK